MDTSICFTTSPSVCQSPHKSVALSINNTASPIHLSYDQSVHHPIHLSMKRQSVTPPISPTILPSDRPSLSDHLYTILPSLSDHPSLPDHLHDIQPSPSACLSLSNSLTTTTTHPTVHLVEKPLFSIGLISFWADQFSSWCSPMQRLLLYMYLSQLISTFTNYLTGHHSLNGYFIQ